MAIVKIADKTQLLSLDGTEKFPVDKSGTGYFLTTEYIKDYVKTVNTSRNITGDDTLLLSDAGKILYVDNNTPVILTLNAEASTAWPAGTTILVVNKGSGDVFIKAQSSAVTINGTANAACKIGSGVPVFCHKVGSNSWYVTDSEVVDLSINMQSVSIDSSGNILTISFDKAISGTNGFTLSVSGETYTLSTPTISGSILSFTTPKIYDGQSVVLSYTPGNVTASSTGAALAPITNYTVNNESTALPTTAYAVSDVGDWDLLNGVVRVTETNVTYPGASAAEQLRPTVINYIPVADDEYWNVEFTLRDNTGDGDPITLQFQEDGGLLLLEKVVTLSAATTTYIIRGPVTTAAGTGVAFPRIRSGTTGIAKNIEITGVKVWKNSEDSGGEPITTFYYLEDQPPNNVTRTLTSPLATTNFPIIGTGSLKTSPTAEQLACFDIVNAKIFNESVVASAQAINPNLVFIRIICPQEYQGWNDAAGKTGNGIPFDTTDVTTNGTGAMFAGHWLYKAYTTLSGNINNTTLTITVADSSNISAGQYICIHDGSFGQAEFMRVQAVSGNTITLSERGYKSTAQSHFIGDHVAMLQLGNGGGDARNWCYNLSTSCPVDGAGNTFVEFAAPFYASIYDEDANGNAADCVVSGILSDSDFLQFVSGGGNQTRECDVDNDGNADAGMLPNGTNAWGNGLRAYYKAVRDAFDARGGTHLNSFKWIGDAHTIGLDACSCGQFEGFAWHIYSATGTSNPARGYISEYNSWVKANMHGEVGPLVGDLQNKARCKSYYAGTPAPEDDSSHRFCTAMSCVFGQSVSHMNGFGTQTAENGGPAFHWFDDYSVCTATDDPTYSYGQAIPPSDTTAIRTYKGWLGQPTGPYQRVYGTEFAVSNALFVNDCSSTSGFSGFGGVSVSVNTTSPYQGTSCIRVVSTSPGIYSYNSGVNINGTALTPGQEYTLVFATRSTNPREITVGMAGAQKARLAIPGNDQWMKQIYSFTASNTTTTILIETGNDGSTFDIDDIMLFAGSAEVFKREFDNGIVVANGSDSAVTIDLGGVYNKIDGQQDRSMNDGTTGLTSITLPARDACLLIKPAP